MEEFIKIYGKHLGIANFVTGVAVAIGVILFNVFQFFRVSDGVLLDYAAVLYLEEITVMVYPSM
jgi:hypothetical protein